MTCKYKLWTIQSVLYKTRSKNRLEYKRSIAKGYILYDHLMIHLNYRTYLYACLKSSLVAGSWSVKSSHVIGPELKPQNFLYSL